MSGLRLLIVLSIVAALVGVVVLHPGVRQSVVGFFQSAKKDIGPGEPPATIGGQVRVYVPRGDKYYHVKSCPRLQGIIAVPMPLDEARALYAPCPDCNPPQ
jgi:hypothetical protein